ncbi:MAG: hypothetical protein WB588_02535 [Dehalococcoidia bacterium]
MVPVKGTGWVRHLGSGLVIMAIRSELGCITPAIVIAAAIVAVVVIMEVGLYRGVLSVRKRWSLDWRNTLNNSGQKPQEWKSALLKLRKGKHNSDYFR